MWQKLWYKKLFQGYDYYTGFILQTYFGLYFLVMFLQFFTLLLVKMCTGHEFYNRRHVFPKINHIFENLNYASPYIDWDVAPSSGKGFKDRYRYFVSFVSILKHRMFNALYSVGWSGRCFGHFWLIFSTVHYFFCLWFTMVRKNCNIFNLH